MNQLKKISSLIILTLAIIIGTSFLGGVVSADESTWFEERIAQNDKIVDVEDAKVIKAKANGGYIKIDKIAQSLSKIMVSLSMGIATIAVALAGYEYMTANGRPEKVYAAKTKIIYVFVGLSIVMLASTLIEIFAKVLGI